MAQKGIAQAPLEPKVEMFQPEPLGRWISVPFVRSFVSLALPTTSVALYVWAAVIITAILL
jgi:hypothetical protein